MQTLFNVNAPLCEHGMRGDCPVKQCRMQDTKPSVLYSSALKGRANPATTKGPLTRQCQSGMEDKCPSKPQALQHTNTASLQPPPDSLAAPVFSGVPSADTMVGWDVVQAFEELTFQRTMLESLLIAQKAKIRDMCSNNSIPLPNLDENLFKYNPLRRVAPQAWNVVPATPAKEITTTTNIASSVQDDPVLSTAPSAPRLQPAQPVQDSWQSQGMPPHTVGTTASGPFGAGAPVTSHRSQQSIPVAPAGFVPKQLQATSTAPKKDDLAYKTTPCRHFTLNKGWCPWGDKCGFIHDPELEWVPPSDRTSGCSTPTVVGSKPVPTERLTAWSNVDPPRSVSNKSAHCWGYIQGVCPHAERCKYFHPEDIEPYMKYTPCLTWPLCGYPASQCALKHPQFDQHHRSQRPSTPRSTTIVPQPQEIIVPRAEAYPITMVPPQTQLPSASPSPLPTAESFVIPHEEAYASAMRHHRPTMPSPGTFSPAPVRTTVRLRRPDVDVPQDQAGVSCGIVPGGGYQGRARRFSIAVQRLEPEFVWSAPPAQARERARGHGRGKSLNL